jgi:hypothetical protein
MSKIEAPLVEDPERYMSRGPKIPRTGVVHAQMAKINAFRNEIKFGESYVCIYKEYLSL